MNNQYETEKNSAYFEKDFFYTGNIKKTKKKSLIDLLIQSCVKLFSFKKKPIEDPKIIALQRSVDSLILNDSLKLLGQVLKNGYEPTTEQYNSIDKLYDKAIGNNENTFLEIANLLNYGIEPTKNSIHKLFFSSIFQINLNSYIDYHEARKNLSSVELSIKYTKRTDKKLVGIYKKDLTVKSNIVLDFFYEYLDHEDNKQALFDNWLYLLKNVSMTNNKKISHEWTLLKPYYIFKHDMIAHLNIEQIQEVLSCFTKLDNCDTKQAVLNDFNKYIDSNNIETVNNLLKDIKDNYSDNPINGINKKYLKKDSQLPLQAQESLAMIESLYVDLYKDENKHEDFYFDIQILINKQVPQIIEKYMSISSQYRNTLINRENKTAKDLLLESLNNIYQTIESVHKNNNHDKLRDLTVSQKYTKQLVRKNNL